MKRRRSEWVEIFEALGEAFFAVLRSEGAVLWRDLWEGSLRRALCALGLFFVAGCLFFVLVALAVTAAVLGVAALWELPAWQATLYVAFAVFALVILLGAVGYYFFWKRFENPLATLRARLDDHVGWWRERLLESERLIGDGDHESQTPKGDGPAHPPTPAG
jgi:hypothetical protein